MSNKEYQFTPEDLESIGEFIEKDSPRFESITSEKIYTSLEKSL